MTHENKMKNVCNRRVRESLFRNKTFIAKMQQMILKWVAVWRRTSKHGIKHGFCVNSRSVDSPVDLSKKIRTQTRLFAMNKFCPSGSTHYIFMPPCNSLTMQEGTGSSSSKGRVFCLRRKFMKGLASL